MTEQSLKAGERRQTEIGDILALSPLPVETDAEASDPFQWIWRKNREFMDLQSGNLVFAAELALMFLSLTLLTVGAGFILTMAVYFDRGTWNWDPPMYLIILNAFCPLWQDSWHYLIFNQLGGSGVDSASLLG